MGLTLELTACQRKAPDGAADGSTNGVAAASGVALGLASAPSLGNAPASSAVPATSAAAPANTVAAELRQRADELLAAHRKMVVLMTGERTLKPTERRAVSAVGQMLFHELQARQEALVTLAGNTADPATLPALEALLDRIESEPSWFDADRLVFKEFLTRLSALYGNAQSIPGLKLARRANEDLAVLAEVEAAYDRELKDIFGRFAKRGIELKREKWADYVAKLQALYSREQILKDFATIVPYSQPAAGKSAVADEADAREIFGTSLPPKTVALTFDDGPHGKYTDDILEILKRYDAPAIFFHRAATSARWTRPGRPS